MHWYVYSPGLTTKACFGEHFFRVMAKTWNADAHIMTREALYFFIRAEFELFEYFLKHVLNCGILHCKGNPFAQGQHDDVTLEDGNGYTSYGVEFMFDDRDWTLAFGFPRSSGHSAVDGKEQFEEIFRQRTRCAVKQVVSSIVSDVAALSVAKALRVDAIACGMHQGDKVGRWACGTLKKSKNHEPVDPFEAGDAIVEQQHNVAKEYSYGKRLNKLLECCNEENCPGIKPQLDLNTTRVAAQHTLIRTNIRIHKAHNRSYYHIINYQPFTTTNAYPCTLNRYVVRNGSEARVQKLAVTPGEWMQATEMEAVLSNVAQLTTIAQHERAWTGAF
jgi:hypothetical protein